MFIRADLYLKDKFFDVVDLNWRTIRFPSICWIGGHVTEHGNPRVNIVMLFTPNKYFEKSLKNTSLSHEMWDENINSFELKYEDMDVMVDTFHDSDSAKDFNPYYLSLIHI
jgi:hypothetical protein